MTRIEEASRRRSAGWEGVRYCVGVFLGVRVGLLLFGLISIALFPPRDPVSVPGWPAHALPDPGWHNLFTAWERFDGLWFLRIAAEGYRAHDGSAAFFPLYPLTIRAVSFLLGGHTFAASLLVSNVALLGALVVLYALTRSELSESVARTTVVLLAFFPTSFFFFAPYSESLFLLLTVTALWAARRGRWGMAALAGSGAALTRNIGVVVPIALAVEGLQQWREDKGSPVSAILAALGGLCGTLAYLVFWQLKVGDLLAPIHQQANWERTLSAPWTTLIDGTRDAFGYVGQTNGGYWLIDWLIVVPVLAASIWASFRRYRWAYLVYLWGGLLAPLVFVFPGRPLMSMPRFVLPLFPAFWAMAEVLQRWRVPLWAVVAIGAAGLGLLTALFVNWYYIF